MIVTIDGPAGAGKSTVARLLAEQLDYVFLDTGAMYRCVAYLAIKKDVPWQDQDALGELARELPLEFEQGKVRLGDEDVSQEIRSETVTAAIHHAADNLQVRAALVALQRKLSAGRNVVTEGRDQGTVAFPDAECKIYLSASPEERARRRVDQLNQAGQDVTFAEILKQQALRDQQDQAREVGGLQAAEDAVFVITDGLTLLEVVAHIERLVRLREEDPRSETREEPEV